MFTVCLSSIYQMMPPFLFQRDSLNVYFCIGFTKEKIPDDLDAIVIGSGIGGMTAAATMAKVGKRVLVLEQHDVAGGCCHSFTKKGFEFDAGMYSSL